MGYLLAVNWGQVCYGLILLGLSIGGFIYAIKKGVFKADEKKKSEKDTIK